jgi:hypothetical protein
MATRKVKRSRRKSRRSKGGMFGYENPNKTREDNYRDYNKYWAHKTGPDGDRLYSRYDENMNYPGQTSRLFRSPHQKKSVNPFKHINLSPTSNVTQYY